MPFFIFCGIQSFSQGYAIIPKPRSLQTLKGSFQLGPQTVIQLQGVEPGTADFFNDYLEKFYGYRLAVGKPEKNKKSILLESRNNEKSQQYEISMNPNTIHVTGEGSDAVFNGMITLIQMLPPSQSRNTTFNLPCVRINDEPVYAYRGMHLDVCRHFFPVEFILKYIDYLALHKFNEFHWHLTDDQGWRIEIPEFPRLTEVGAWRNGTIVGRYPGTGNDQTRYGGFYTEQEVHDIVQYARSRHINVIPEIEMPGHSSAAIAAYPWLSCFPQQPTVIPSWPSIASEKAGGKLVQETWGVFDDIFCAGNDSTFLFLYKVLDDVMALFPSTYIHVGGDECPKTNWNKCPKCQARMKSLGLKTGAELQSWFMSRIDAYLTQHGRKMFGWDEIIEGGISPNALIMSWRGEKGGLAAAAAGHHVVMTPQKPLYFDHTQSANEDSLVIGGFNPIEAVYAYSPVGSAKAETARYILGAQANLWTEYVDNPSKVEYMVFPRMAALSEVLWSLDSSRRWADFEQRLPTEFKRYDLWGAHYSRAVYDVKTLVFAQNQKPVWEIIPRKPRSVLSFTDPQNKVSYVTTDSTGFPLSVKGYYTVQLIAAEPQPGKEPVAVGSPVSIFYVPHLATGHKISLATKPVDRYPGQGGAYGLINGIASLRGLSYPDWQGWIGDDVVANIDLEQQQTVAAVRFHTLDQNGSWIYLPKDVTVSLSTDGINFNQVGSSSDFQLERGTSGWITIQFPGMSARYIRVVARNYGMIPDGKPGAGNKAWLMTDEIQVY